MTIDLYSSNDKQLMKKYVPEVIQSLTDYELVTMAQGDSNPRKRDLAKQALLFRHLAIVRFLARKYSRGDLETTTLNAVEGFFKGLQKFDVNNPKKVQFKTYVWWDVRKAAQRDIKKSKVGYRKVGLESVAEPSCREGLSWYIRQDVREAVGKLSGRRKYVVESFYGLGDTPSQTVQEIAKELGLSMTPVKRDLYQAREELKEHLCAYSK